MSLGSGACTGYSKIGAERSLKIANRKFAKAAGSVSIREWEMSSSLVGALQGLVTPALVKSVGGVLGETDSSVASGLGSAISKILGGLAHKSGDTGVMDAVAEMVNAQARDPSGLNDLRGLLAGGIPTSVASLAGNQLLGAVLGANTASAVSSAGGTSGLSPGAASASLFSLGAPMVLGALGQRLGGGGVTGMALSSLIGSEKESLLAKFVPSLGGVASAATAAVAATTAAAAAVTAPARPAPQPVQAPVAAPVVGKTPVAPAPAPAPSVAKAPVAPSPAAVRAATTAATVAPRRSDNGLFTSFLWLLVPLSFVGYLYWDKFGREPVAVPAPVAPIEGKSAAAAPAAAPAAPEPAPAPAPEPAAAASDASGNIKIALSGGGEITASSSGVESKMLAFIADSNAAIDKNTWFDFDRLNFETGSTTLTADSKAQVDNIAAILKAFPEVKVKIGGYTDNVGSPDNNLKLSDNRAKAVMTELVGLGVAADRVEAEGYGEQHPVADNSTDDGRAKNRRTALSIRAK